MLKSKDREKRNGWISYQKESAQKNDQWQTNITRIVRKWNENDKDFPIIEKSK
jgi:hypothetical protein